MTQEKMQYLPVGVDLHNKQCVVIGGGPIAARKIERLIEAGAQVQVYSLAICDEIEAHVSAGTIAAELNEYKPEYLENAALVVAATNDTAVNQQIAVDAERLGVLCNAAESSASGSVIFPSVIRRGLISISICSDGSSPVLAKVLSNQIDAFVPQSVSKLASLAVNKRLQVKERFTSVDARRGFWSRALTGQVTRLLEAGNETAAREQLEHSLENGSADGEVYLVGAGPGDPELLTLRALRLMQQAEVILHDRLVSDEILALCPGDAQFLYVGKERSSHAMRQHNINKTLVKYARQGKRVLRLKGGDPFIFGRGGEEIETLAEQGINFQLVPGITAASGCASYAGIPLTHRDHAQSCVFVAGQLKDGTINLPWKSLAIPRQTIVCYMGLVGLAHICTSLTEAGLVATTPAALVEQGTTKRQRVIVGDLATLPELVARESVTAPTLIIIGDVVKLQSKLAWLESRS